MKSSLPSTSRKHQALLADITKAGRAQAQQEKARSKDEQSADAQITAFFDYDGFEQAFAQAEYRSELRRPIGPPQADTPPEPTSARLQQKRPMPLQQQVLCAPQPQTVFVQHRSGHNEGLMHASPELRQDRAILLAAVAVSARPPLAVAKRPKLLSLPNAGVMHGDLTLPTLDASWARATAGQAAAWAKGHSTTQWPPKSRL